LGGEARPLSKPPFDDPPFAAARPRGVPRASTLGFAIAALPLAALLLARPWTDVALTRDVYLPIHTAAELLVVVIAFASFAVQWYAGGAAVFREARARFVGTAFFAVAALEACHLFSFPGMPAFIHPSSTERGIYYWLAARTWTVVTLLGALAIDPRSAHPLLRRGPLLVWNLAAVGAIVALDAVLPADRAWFFVEGAGLTDWKLGAEIAYATAAAVGAWLYLRRASGAEAVTYHRIASALGYTTLGAVSLMVYRHPYDPFNLLGHAYLLLSARALLHALFVAAVVRPHAELARSNAELEGLRGHVEGELAETIAQLRDSTHKEAAARAHLEAALATVPGALLMFSRDGTLVLANAAADRLLGIAGSPGRTHAGGLQLLSPKTADGKPLGPEASPIVRALQGATVDGLVLHIAPPGREPAWVAVSAAPVRIPDGGHGAAAVFADVTELVNLQEQREDILRAVSHDLRNPLQIVLLQAQRLKKMTEDEKPRRAADAVLGAARRMEGMIRDLVESARLESGSLVLRREPVQLRRYVDELLAQSAGVLEVGRVRNAVPELVPAVDADPARLDRIVLNLVGNALKYSSEGDVEIRADVNGIGVRVSVSDRGPGIPFDDLPRLFERYHGGGPRSADGLGLGLFIVRKLVEAHGGSIHAESILGQGSTFVFTLPAARV
jgi:signal transduction histidine kinase